MALNLITNPPTVLATDTDWTDLVARSDINMIGHGLSIPIFTLGNWETGALEPIVKEGSIIEVGGSFYQADSDTVLTADTGLSDGLCHIKLVPAGAGATVVPTLTSDALPTWDAEKGGWYDTDDKFLPFVMTKSSTSYTAKGEYVGQTALIIHYVNGGAYFSGDTSFGGNISSNLQMVGSLLPKTSIGGNEETISGGSYYELPRGCFNIFGVNNLLTIRFLQGGVWYDSNLSGNTDGVGGFVMSTGSNVRVYNDTGSPYTFRYHSF